MHTKRCSNNIRDRVPDTVPAQLGFSFFPFPFYLYYIIISPGFGFVIIILTTESVLITVKAGQKKPVIKV